MEGHDSDWWLSEEGRKYREVHNDRLRRIRGYAIYRNNFLALTTGQVEMYGFPEDAEFVKSFVDPFTEDTIVVVCSQTFEKVPEGAQMPIYAAETRQSRRIQE